MKKTFKCAVCKAVTKIKLDIYGKPLKNYIEGKRVCSICFENIKQANADKRSGMVRVKNPSWLDCKGERHFREGNINPPKRVKRIFKY